MTYDGSEVYWINTACPKCGARPMAMCRSMRGEGNKRRVNLRPHRARVAAHKTSVGNRMADLPRHRDTGTSPRNDERGMMWADMSGRRTPLRELDDDHLRNIERWVRLDGETQPAWDLRASVAATWQGPLVRELAHRGLAPKRPYPHDPSDAPRLAQLARQRDTGVIWTVRDQVRWERELDDAWPVEPLL